MAGIDKTYTKVYEDYVNLKNWASKTLFTCSNGLIINPNNYIYDYFKEEDFTGHEIPVMNTPQELDYFLIKYCPLDFVQKRMQVVYSLFYNEVKQGNSEYDTFNINSVKLATKYKIISRPKYIRKIKKRKKLNYFDNYKLFYIECKYYTGEYNTYIYYNNKLKRFIYHNELHNGDLNKDKFNNCKSIKALCRNLIKAKIPSNTTVEVSSDIGYWEIVFK